MPENGQIKRYRRFKGWDYTKGASLFITIATAPRRALFGRIVNGAMVLSPLGEKVKEAVEAIPLLNPGIMLFGHVVMPDHIHFNCALVPGLREPLKVLGNAIRRFKNYTTKLAKLARLAEHSSAITASGGVSDSAIKASYGEVDSAITASGGVSDSAIHAGSGEVKSVNNAGYMGNGKGAPSTDGRAALGQLWQQGYHDYILISREMIDSTERYIAYNPLKWEVMYGADHALRVVEPLASPRLNIGDYWKGVGNLALLGEGFKMVSLRISRQVASPAAIAKVVKRIESAVDKGYVVISGFISRGEKAVRDMLCRRSDARFIRVLPSCIPNQRFRPESIYVKPFSEGRYLEIGKGNDEVAFGRGACLDINAEIIEIATAGEGLAIYWKGDGAHILAGLAEHSSAINAGVGVDDSAINAGIRVGDSAITAGGGVRDSAITADGGHVLQQGCLPGFHLSNDGQTGFGQSGRGL